MDLACTTIKLVENYLDANATSIIFRDSVTGRQYISVHVETHHKLQGSEDLLRLTMCCVVSVFWPQKEFQFISLQHTNE